MNAHDGRAAEGADGHEVRVLGSQPVDGVRGVVHQGHDQVEVVDALAADHGIQGEQLRGIEVADRVGLVRLKLRLDGRNQISQLRILFLRAGDGLLDRGGGGVLPLVLVLRGGLRGVHAARRAGGVAAGGAGLLHDDDVLHAQVSRLQRSGHARAAGADDDDVAVGVLDSHVLGLHQARRDHGFLGRRLDRVGRHGRAGDAVDAGALRLHDLRGKGAVLAGFKAAEARGLAVAGDDGFGDLAVLHGQGDGHRADAVVIAGKGFSRRAGDHAGQHQHGKKNGCKLFHG